MSFTDLRTVAVRQDGWCLHLTLNRPEVRNAINAQMWDDVEQVFDAIREDRSIRAVVLRGAGGYFCSGGDLKERRTITEDAGVDGADPLMTRNLRAGRLFTKIDHAPQAVIAAVEGGALGGGFGLVCASDIAAACNDARFGLPEATLGIPPAQILPYLVRRIGMTQVRRLALTAARFDGAEAARLGIVHAAVQDAAALDAWLAQTLALIDRCGPSAIAASKRLMHQVATTDADAMMKESARLFAVCVRSDEGLEGAAAAREKRVPAWASRATRSSA
ncbi:MAG: enoyl-CoA hydratase/isomerase family protein [Rhizobiales bacterium]|nr:enoyl-CoA hydratase/isomerase family protein [Hyphomicrobiales bacterium]